MAAFWVHGGVDGRMGGCYSLLVIKLRLKHAGPVVLDGVCNRVGSSFVVGLGGSFNVT